MTIQNSLGLTTTITAGVNCAGTYRQKFVVQALRDQNLLVLVAFAQALKQSCRFADGGSGLVVRATRHLKSTIGS